MSMFTIDSENNIAAHAEIPAGSENMQSFATERELAKLSAEWPGSRLVEVWNSFAGVAPFTGLKPVKKFTNRRNTMEASWKDKGIVERRSLSFQRLVVVIMCAILIKVKRV